jgi:hypothetical protein
MSDQHRRIPKHVLHAGAAAAASSQLTQAVRVAEGAATVPDPARGQLWRAAWDDVTQLVMVIEVSQPGTVTVVPVTTDPPAADDTSVVLDAGMTILGQTATVWGGIAAPVPLVVFDLLIGAVGAAVVNAVEQVAVGGQTALPTGITVGPPVTSPFDPAAEVCAGLTDNLERLRVAAWAPAQSGSAQTLRDLLGKRLDLDALQAALGVGLPAVIGIVMGKRPVTPDQAAAIAAVTGLTAQQVLAAVPPVPAELVHELDHPRWRAALRAHRQPHESEAAARLTVAYGVLALAARQTGPTSAPSWPQRIRQYLATEPTGQAPR